MSLYSTGDWERKVQKAKAAEAVVRAQVQQAETIIAEASIPQLDNSITSAVNVKSRAVPRT